MRGDRLDGAEMLNFETLIEMSVRGHGREGRRIRAYGQRPAALCGRPARRGKGSRVRIAAIKGAICR
jgi:hypothetical protein